MSRPVARLFAAIARRIDARWRAKGRRTLLSPRGSSRSRAITSSRWSTSCGGSSSTPRLGPIDTSLGTAPLVGLIVDGARPRAVAPAARPRVGPGLAIGGVGDPLAIAARQRVAPGRRSRSTIWGERPFAGLAIDRLFDLDAIRADISLAEFRPSDRPGSPHPDIVLVTIDTVRADHTPPYGGSAEMPVLRELAVRGTVFDYAYAPSNVTRRSIPSMVIGLAPNRVQGPRRRLGAARRSAPRPASPSACEAGGYETAGFMCCEGFWGKTFHTGLQRGLAAPRDRAERARARHAARTLARRARPAPRRQAPLFLWMHILEPHNWTQGVGEPHSEADEAPVLRPLADRRGRRARRAAARVRGPPARARADRDRHRRSRRGARRARPALSLDRSLQLADPGAAGDRRPGHRAAARSPRPSA